MNQRQKFSIGQIVYILSEKGQSIIPAMVVEEQTIQTLQGTTIFWKIAIGEAGPKQKIVDSTKLAGEIYPSLEEIRILLTKRLTQFIEDTIKMAKKRETVWYGKLKNENKTPIVEQNSKTDTRIDPESFLNGMDELTTKQDSEISIENNFTQFSEELQQQSLKEKLKNSIIPSREELESGFDSKHSENGGQVVIHGPDGNLIMANLKTTLI